VISVAVFGSSEMGFARASTYRGRPPGQDELEEGLSFNGTEERPSTPAFTDGSVPVDGRPVRARVAFVPATGQASSARWDVLLFGRGYSAHISLDSGMTPEQLLLSSKDDTVGYTDIPSVLRNIPER
jgi:hypothetical protein